MFNRACQNAHSSEYWTCQLTDCGYFQLRCAFSFWFRCHSMNISYFNLLLKKIYQRRLIVFCIYSISRYGLRSILYISRQFTITINKTHVTQFSMEHDQMRLKVDMSCSFPPTPRPSQKKTKMYFLTML